MNKVLDKDYLLHQLRLMAGKELYGDVTSVTETAVATAKRYDRSYDISEYAFYKYNGAFEATDITTAEEADQYTTDCGETIVIGDKVRPSILVTDDNISKYASVTGLKVGDYLIPADDCRMAGMASDIGLGYLNKNFFQTENVELGEYIFYTPATYSETTTELANYIQNLYSVKMDILNVTQSVYQQLVDASKTKANTLYFVSDASPEEAWLNGVNLLSSSGGVDITGAEDGYFLVYNATEGKPVWVNILDAMTIGW